MVCVGFGIGYVCVCDLKCIFDCFGFYVYRKFDVDIFFDIILKFLIIFKLVNIIRNEVIFCGIVGYFEWFVCIYMLFVRYVDDCKIEDKEGLCYLEL